MLYSQQQWNIIVSLTSIMNILWSPSLCHCGDVLCGDSREKLQGGEGGAGRWGEKVWRAGDAENTFGPSWLRWESSPEANNCCNLLVCRYSENLLEIFEDRLSSPKYSKREELPRQLQIQRVIINRTKEGRGKRRIIRMHTCMKINGKYTW